MTKLSIDLNISKSKLSKIIGKLIRKNLISQKSLTKEDRRFLKVELHIQGFNLINKLIASINAEFMKKNVRYTDTDLQTAVNILEAISQFSE